MGFQLKSFQAQEIAESINLYRHLKEYNKVKRKIKKYGEAFIRRLYRKYSKRPEVLKRVLVYEVEMFCKYYEYLLSLIQEIESDEKNFEIHQNLSILQDSERMRGLIASIEEKQESSVLWTELVGVLEKVEKEARKYERKEAKAYWKRKRLYFKQHPESLNPIVSWILTRTGVAALSRRIYKRVNKLVNYRNILTHDTFVEMQEEINTGQINPTTVSRLQLILKNYVKLRRYYTQIDDEITIIYDNLFTDLDKLLKENVIPFYAVLKQLPEAKSIEKITLEIKEKYEDFKTEMAQEEFEIKDVHERLMELIATCREAEDRIIAKNKGIVKKLEEDMSISLK